MTNGRNGHTGHDLALLANTRELNVHAVAAPAASGGGLRQEEVDRFAQDVRSLVSNITTVVVASDRTVKLTLLGLFAKGHVLLEDLPGVGKTLLAKTIACSLSCDFKRVQFTPDLLPSDVTGTSVFNMREMRFDFIPGPIFSNIVLADEINRTSPRTQSALLEAMAEYQVSVEGEPRLLPAPFMVIATQNASESHGAFPLPESQLDRFLVSLGMGLPSPADEAEILTRSQHGMPEVGEVLTAERVVQMQETVQRVEVALPVRQYIVNLVRTTRSRDNVEFGVSPRGGAALQRAAQGWAAFAGRTFVLPEDVKDVAPSVLSHRIGLQPGATVDTGEVVAEILRSLAVPA